MRSLEESRTRWQVTTKQASSFEALKKSVKTEGDDNPCISGLRSVCWKTFLLFQTTEITTWSRPLLDSRSAYTSLRDRLLRLIEHPDELGSALDPLDDDQNSPWNTLRQDEEMRAEIFQDVERCMPEEPYFRQPQTQRIMLDILFVFCKINQDVGYRQGMHELLAPILWVVEQDAIVPKSLDGDKSKASAESDESILSEILDSRYVEHDAFTLLSLIMRSAKSFYELSESDGKSGNLSTGLGQPQHTASPIVERSKRIHEVYLARLDPELAKHLTNIEVLPQIFLIRWIRLLFGREFPFDDLLALWDTLLAEDPALDLVDMVCVAMLLRIRWQLMESNYSSALMLLLKYPSPSPPIGPQTFVDDAIYLRDNFSGAGGANLINKYSGKLPSLHSSSSRPSTPLGQALSPQKRYSRAMSPLQSSARILQQQGGVEALFQGAAKGVFERGEKLGINQAVRNAVGEVRKNMQELQASRANSVNRKPLEATRWPLDEGRPTPASQASVSAMNKRNQQLARMLDDAMTGLRAASASEDGDKETFILAMELAITKVDFVKVYLEDTAMPLPEDFSQVSTPKSLKGTGTSSPEPLQLRVALSTKSTPDTGSKESVTETNNVPQLSPSPSLDATPKIEEPTIQSQSVTPFTASLQADAGAAPQITAELLRPRAPVPTRSSIAQSSFSWMLEPDTSSPSGSSPPKSPSPFLKSMKRPPSTTSREKAAFLFGDDGAESKINNPRLPSLLEPEEVFNLGTMRGGKGKRPREKEDTVE